MQDLTPLPHDPTPTVAAILVGRKCLNVVMLDACRDNPYARRFRSASRGLSQIDVPQGELGSLLA